MFLTTEDYTALIRNEIKDILLENYSEAKLNIAQQMAIDQVKNYLSGRYDVAEIFSQEGTERNAHIVMLTLDCTLYHLYTSTVPKRMPEIRSVRYQDAIDWLKAVGSGDISANLPLIKNQDGQHLIGVKIQSKYKASSNKW
ncbi:MAG: phage protein Gp36 family protein [Capnocytophaga sp.]|uniref:phage protein Gp36 family protein n=1 Tax=Capnocytophaga sp. TaxID=44737 RepID=UPI003FA18462